MANKNKHILYFHQYFNTPEMGGSTRSYEIAKGLVKLGHKVTIVTSLQSENQFIKSKIENIEGFNVHWIKIPYSNKMNFVRRLFAFFEYAFRSAFIGFRIESDIIYASSTPLTVVLPALFCSKLNRIPMIFEVRDLWPNIPIAMGILKNRLLIFAAEFLENLAYTNATHIIALSPDMKSYIINKGICENKITVIPNASDVSFFQDKNKEDYNFRNSLKISEESIIVLYAGTFGNVNGCNYIIELASILKDINHLKFVLIGEGKEKDIIIDNAKKLNLLNENVFILPQVNKNKMPSYLYNSDLVISTITNLKALEANSANKVFDGCAAGKGVLINHGGWISDVLHTSNAGIQLSWDIKEASLQLIELVNNKQLIDTMGLNAAELAKTKFNRKILTDKIDNIIVKSSK